MPLELQTAVPGQGVSVPGQQPSSSTPSQFSSTVLPQISCSGTRPPSQVSAHVPETQVCTPAQSPEPPHALVEPSGTGTLFSSKTGTTLVHDAVAVVVLAVAVFGTRHRRVVVVAVVLRATRAHAGAVTVRIRAGLGHAEVVHAGRGAGRAVVDGIALRGRRLLAPGSAAVAGRPAGRGKVAQTRRRPPIELGTGSSSRGSSYHGGTGPNFRPVIASSPKNPPRSDVGLGTAFERLALLRLLLRLGRGAAARDRGRRSGRRFRRAAGLAPLAARAARHSRDRREPELRGAFGSARNLRAADLDAGWMRDSALELPDQRFDLVLSFNALSLVAIGGATWPSKRVGASVSALRHASLQLRSAVAARAAPAGARAAEELFDHESSRSRSSSRSSCAMGVSWSVPGWIAPGGPTCSWRRAKRCGPAPLHGCFGDGPNQRRRRAFLGDRTTIRGPTRTFPRSWPSP